MAYDVMTVTLKGVELLAAATAEDQLIIAGCDATTTFITKADAVNVSARPANPFSTTTNAHLEKSTTNHVFVRVFFVSGQSTGGEARSLYIFGHKQSDPTNDYVLAVLSSENTFHLPEVGDISNTYGALLDIIYNPAEGSVSTVTASVYATYGEYADLRDRVVTCHKRDLPTTGDDQTIYGTKTFNSEIKSNAIFPGSVLSKTSGDNVYSLKPDWSMYEDPTSKSFGMYSQYLPPGSIYNYTLSTIEERVVYDSRSISSGVIILNAKNEHNTTSEIKISTGYDNGTSIGSISLTAQNINASASNDLNLTATSNIDVVSSDKLYLKAPNEIIAISENCKFITTETPSAIFTNPGAMIETKIINVSDNDNDAETDTGAMAITIQDGNGVTSNFVFACEKPGSGGSIQFNTRHSFYPSDQSGDGHLICIGAPTRKWDDIYADRFHGSLEGHATSASNDSNNNDITSYVRSVEQNSLWETQINIKHGDSTSSTINLNEISALTLLGKADSQSPIYNFPGAIGFFFYKGNKTSGVPGDVIPGTDLVTGGFVRDTSGNVTFQRFDSHVQSGTWKLLCEFNLTNTGDSTIVLAVMTSSSAPSN